MKTLVERSRLFVISSPVCGIDCVAQAYERIERPCKCCGSLCDVGRETNMLLVWILWTGMKFIERVR